MMFDSLVCPLSSDPEEAAEERKDSFEIFKGSTKSLCEEVLTTKTSLEDYEYEFEWKESSDPILTYLRRHYLQPQAQDPQDSSTEPDLSWDEGDLPALCPKVWTFNDFMEQYNSIYSWLNNIQVEHHAIKKSGGSSARVESELRELEKDVERRERFLRECGRMVGSYPELEEEVRWRLEHVMTKWDMLTGLRTKSRNNLNNLQDIYSDIELEVKCLRRWLREMEARIDPLQFSKILEWSARDRERKMAEYQVLQTDIESHGRIVKLVLSLCEELSHNPGQYDLQHAVKVASGLERRWHQIWLRSLEWQCLLEQWLTAPQQEAAWLDTDEEPVAKVARLNTDCDTASSPAVTLLRKKKRKRMINVDLGPEDTLADIQDPEKRIKLKSPRTPRNLAESDLSDSGGDQIVVSRLTESDPSHPSAPSSSRSESSDCVTFLFSERPGAGRERGGEISTGEMSEWRLGDLNLNSCQTHQSCQSDQSVETDTDFTPGQNDFINNTVSLNRKVTVILNRDQVERNLNTFSEDSLEEREEEREEREEEEDETIMSLEVADVDVDSSLTDVTGEEMLSSSEENINNELPTNNLEILHFGEDYRLFISSLSDSSVAGSPGSQSKYRRTKKLRRKNKRRETEESFPYESQSEAEHEEMFLVVARSHRHIHSVEERVAEYLSQGFVNTATSAHLQEYDEILSNCSENINLLHNFLENIHTAQSFVQRKKSRETRLLISRWEKLLQKLLDNVNNSKVFAQLKDDCKHLRERTAVLEDNLHSAISEVDLQSQLRKLKAIQEQLSGQKSKMDKLIISVHSFLASLSTSTSSYVSDCHISLAGELKTAVVCLYSHWDSTNTRVLSSLTDSQQAVTKLNNIERDLLEFRKSLRVKQLELFEKNPRATKQVLRNLKSSPHSLHDSGISEGSSEQFLSDYGLPEALDHLARLKMMTRSLEKSLSPHDPTLLALSSILEDTSSELNDLQRMFLKEKPSPVLPTVARLPSRPKKKSCKHLSRQGRGAEKQRGRGGGRFVRLAVTIQLMLVSLVFLSWLSQPQCCDNISAISPLSFSPHFNFVNGPPPI